MLWLYLPPIAFRVLDWWTKTCSIPGSVRLLISVQPYVCKWMPLLGLITSFLLDLTHKWDQSNLGTGFTAFHTKDGSPLDFKPVFFWVLLLTSAAFLRVDQFLSSNAFTRCVFNSGVIHFCCVSVSCLSTSYHKYKDKQTKSSLENRWIQVAQISRFVYVDS